MAEPVPPLGTPLPPPSAAPKRWDVKYKVPDPHVSDGHRWLKIGTMFPMKEVPGAFYVKVDAIPISFDGHIAIFPVTETWRPKAGE